MKQRIVDILGILILCGILFMVSLIEAFNPNINTCIVLCFEILLLILSVVRILLFRSISKEKRRQYNMRLLDSPRLLGRDTLIYPYTQAVIVPLFLIGTIYH